jgi:hypothetical protein
MATTPLTAPACPHCGRSLGEVGVRAINAETDQPGDVLLVACGACAKVLGVLPGQLVPAATA